MVRTHFHHTYEVPDSAPRAGVWCPTLDTPWKTVTETCFAEVSNAKLRADPGYPVSSFRDLVHVIGELAFYNPSLSLFFRGQGNDYTDSKSRSKLYPSIFRPARGQRSLRKGRIRRRFSRLQQLRRALSESSYRLDLGSRLSQHQEYWVSLIQHYQLCPTPMLDVTQSLRVAASFALMDEQGGFSRSSGYVYVISLPHIYGSISKFADEDLVLARLQSICPPDALRPHFQEGVLVGRWPLSLSKEAGDNLAYRMVGKYRLENSSGNFFDSDFHPIPREALLPSDDPFGKKLRDFADGLPGEDVQ